MTEPKLLKEISFDGQVLVRILCLSDSPSTEKKAQKVADHLVTACNHFERLVKELRFLIDVVNDLDETPSGLSRYTEDAQEELTKIESEG
jgi:hypothetical protein